MEQEELSREGDLSPNGTELKERSGWSIAGLVLVAGMLLFAIVAVLANALAPGEPAPPPSESDAVITIVQPG